ncbi:hypothetical protein HK100_012498 [Physocladia obscura]|uniref:Ubiquitin-conjugating enzyme family protein n=1 Tax=Physocladia obscura TaxID=109957 RepID=A0AAD5T0N2_9FUNG|nr:hypothetical protein HK100_012498 [Physocladia obscura]
MVSSMRRILIEIRGLQVNPMPGIQVYPHDKNMTRLCVWMTPQEGIYEGIPLHVAVGLEGFPAKSPTATLQTYITHPNVFNWFSDSENGSYICCDILKGALVTDARGRVSGYSPAYSLGTILIQLLSFFSAERIEQDGGYVVETRASEWNRKSALRNVRAFNCNYCKFDGNHLTQLIQLASASRNATVFDAIELAFDRAGLALVPHSNSCVAVSDPVPQSLIEFLPVEVILEIAEYLSLEDILKLSQTSNSFEKIIESHNLTIKRNIKCFFHKIGLRDSILGVGVWVSEKGRNRDMKPVDFDILSHEAFTVDKIRKTIWGQRFTNFLPLALSSAHFLKSLRVLKQAICDLDFGADFQSGFTPSAVLRVLPKLMNLMVVDLMKTCDGEATFTQTTYSEFEGAMKTKMLASEKSLIGYSQLLHLLLSLCRKYPQIVTMAQSKISQFLSNNATRGKNDCSNLGEFIVLLFCQDKYIWNQLAIPVLCESFIRNVVWMLDPAHGNKPHLAFLEKATVSEFRLKETFAASQTSCRLLMFQVLFMKKLGLVGNKSLDVLGQLDRSYGYPKSSLASQLMKEIKGIYAVESFDKFLLRIGIPVPTKVFFCSILKNSVSESARRKYHQCPLTQFQLSSLRKAAEPGIMEIPNRISIPTIPNNLTFFPQKLKEGIYRHNK